MAAKRNGLIWEPLPGPQTTALQSNCPDLFYGGERGGGKTEFLFGDWLAHEKLYGDKASGLFLRRTTLELAECIKRAGKIFPRLGAEKSGKPPVYRFPSGATLRFSYCDNDDDAENYQGHEYTWVGVDEAGRFPNPSPIDFIIGSCRSTQGVPIYVRLTGNPGGPGHQWLKRRYVDPAEPGKPFPDHDARTWRLFVKSRLSDNPLLLENDPSYVDRLYAATVGKPWLRKNWLEGDWNAIPDDTPFRHVNYYEEQPNHLRLFWVMDMAYTRKKTSDFTASCIFGADEAWNLYELSYTELQGDASERLDFIFTTAEHWLPRGIDRMFLEAHIDWFDAILPQEMERRNYDFAVTQLKPGGVPKDDRIRDNVGRWLDRLYFKPGSKLAQRVMNYQGGREVNGEPDDGPDALAYLCMEAGKAAALPPASPDYDPITAARIQKREELLFGRRQPFEVVR